MNNQHTPFMRRTLDLATRGRGKTGINPMVGAVLVREVESGKLTPLRQGFGGQEVESEAFHSGFGNLHAERDLLQNYEQKISSTDTLYINLEPCCHTGKTPPCTDIILHKNVKRVVYGMRDPNPLVAGKGIEILRKNGVEVIGPVLEDECLRLNRGFVSVQMKGRPWITLKSARISDGKIANADGSPLKITNAAQDEWSHKFLRARHDAILVGVGTVIADDPELTVRFSPPSPSCPAGPGGGARGGGSMGGEEKPYRIILDPDFRTPLTAKVVNSPLSDRTIIIVSSIADTAKAAVLRDRGVRISVVKYIDGQFDWQDLWKALLEPDTGFYGITSVLVEGGAKTWEMFRNAGIVDEEVTLFG